MIRLIRADVRRILQKLTFYICPLIFFVEYLMDLGKAVTDFDVFYVKSQTSFGVVLPILTCIPVVLGVFADELKAGALQTVIGRGVSRKKIVFTKFIDCVILTLILYVFYFVCKYTQLRLNMIVPTSLQMERYIIMVVSSFVKVTGGIGFAAIFVYLTWNSSMGIIVSLLTITFGEEILKTIQRQFKIPVLDISFYGQVNKLTADVAARNVWLIPCAGVVVYLMVYVLISMLIFDKKELNL